jgi:hypothetical protein
MFTSKKRRMQREGLDRAGQKVLRAVKMSEAEADAIADAPHLYAHLRRRITAKRSADGRLENVSAARPVMWRRSAWSLTALAAAILIAVAVIAPRWLRSPAPQSISPELHSLATTPPPVPTPRASGLAVKSDAKAPASAGATMAKTAGPQERRAPRRREVLVNASQTEIATDFIPLTYLPDLGATEGGRIVRIRIPRATLVSFGLPMNAERAGEMVNAEVVLGNDGLARAIRFIQ